MIELDLARSHDAPPSLALDSSDSQAEPVAEESKEESNSDKRAADRDRVYREAVEAARVKKYQELEQERANYLDLPFFLNPYYKQLIKEYREKRERGEVSKQRFQHLLMLARMRILGIKKPKQTLNQIFNNSDFYKIGRVDENDPNSRLTIKRIKYDGMGGIAELVDSYSKLKNPGIAISRLEQLGVNAFFYPILMERVLPEVHEKIEAITKLSEDEFRVIAEKFQQHWWLARIRIEEKSPSEQWFDNYYVVSPEFSARVDYLLSNGELNETTQSALNIQEELKLLEYLQVPAYLVDAVNSPDKLQMLQLVAKELGYVEKDNEHRYPYRVSELLQVLWHSPQHLEMVYSLLNQGWQLKPSTRSWKDTSPSSFLGNIITADDKKQMLAAIELVSALTADPAVDAIRQQLGIQTIEDAQLLDDVLKAIQTTKEIAASMPAKRRASSIETLQLFDTPFSQDIFSDEEKIFIQAWANIPWQSEELKNLALEALATDSDGNLNKDVLLHLLEDRASYFEWVNPEKLANLPRNEQVLIALIQTLEPKYAAPLRVFLVSHRRDIDTLTDEHGNITAEFVREWFSNKDVWNTEDLLVVEPLLEKANLVPGFAAHIRFIESTKGLEGMVLKEHLWPIFKIFQEDNASADNIELFNYWLKNDPRIFVKLLSKDSFKQVFGSQIAERFLSALPKETEEQRNAFLHNDYDRTSKWLGYMLGMTQARTEQPWVLPGWPIAMSTSMSFNLETDLEMATDFISDYGLAFSEKILMIYKQLWLYERGTITALPADFAELGIESTDDLKEQLEQLHSLIVAREPFLDADRLSSFQVMLLGLVTGHTSHKWSYGRPKIEQIVTDFSRDSQAGNIEPTSEGYTVHTISLQEVEIEYEPSEAALAQYDTLSNAVQTAFEELNNPDFFQRIAAEFTAILEDKQEELEQLLSQVEENKRKGIQIQQQRVSGYLETLRDIKTPGQLLIFLSTYRPEKQQQKQWEKALSALVMHRLLSTTGASAIQDMTRLAGGELDAQRILIARNVIGELVKHHGIDFSSDDISNYWDEHTIGFFRGKESKQALKNLTKLFGTMEGVFREEVNTFQKRQKTVSQQVEFIPDRGIIGELSGYIANACYTSEYPLLKDRKVVPYKFVEARGNERNIIGSVLLFEVETFDRKKALLVRAFNVPDEKTYDSVELLEQFLDYCQEAAANLGKDLVLLPGDNGAISNYSMVLNHVDSKYKTEQNRAKLSERFNFNNYDLTNHCFVVRQVGPLFHAS